MESCYEDLRPQLGTTQNLLACPALDRKRNDLRIQQFVANASAFQTQYPGCDVHTFLCGERIAGRYTEISLQGQGPLHQYGRVRLGEGACRHWIKADIDLLAAVDKKTPGVQPRSYPHGNATSTGWADLTRTQNGKWMTETRYTPQSSVPSRFRPRKDWIVRFAVDANVLDDRDATLLQFANRFVGDVKFTGLPGVGIEVKQGGWKRFKHWLKLMNNKWSDNLSDKNLPLNSTPMVYRVDQAPAPGQPLTGDLRILAQLGLAIKGYVTRVKPKGKKVAIVFVTEDYICGQLVKCVRVDKQSAVLKCLRIEEHEKGDVFEDLLWNAAEDYCERI